MLSAQEMNARSFLLVDKLPRRGIRLGPVVPSDHNIPSVRLQLLKDMGFRGDRHEYCARQSQRSSSVRGRESGVASRRRDEVRAPAARRSLCCECRRDVSDSAVQGRASARTRGRRKRETG